MKNWREETVKRADPTTNGESVEDRCTKLSKGCSKAVITSNLGDFDRKRGDGRTKLSANRANCTIKQNTIGVVKDEKEICAELMHTVYAGLLVLKTKFSTVISLIIYSATLHWCSSVIS